MKKLLFVALMMILLSQLSYARIWRVNNIPGVVADFTTPQAAHDAAAAGDTIHLEPSTIVYAGVTCSKRLVWLSIGEFLDNNPGLQYTSTPGTLSTMYLQGGSEGSVVSVVNNSAIYVYVSNITIVRSFASTISCQSGAITNLLINQCYVPNNIGLNGNNNIVSNNIAGYITTSSTGNGAVITNNVFFVNAGVTIYNAVFQNNIVKAGTYTFNNAIASYNMHSGTGIPAGNNNQQNVNMANVFENNSPTSDRDYRLKAGSPAIGTGFGGTDMGAFGGSTPYVLALQPAIPAITNLASPSSAVNNVIQVTFSAKSNN